MGTGLSCDRLGVVGTGRVARAMLRVLGPMSRSAPMLWGRTPAHAREAASHVRDACLAESGSDLLGRCDLILIAVSDDAVADVARGMAEHGTAGQRPFIFHVSGRSGAAILEPLERLGALTAAIHPVMPFTGDTETEALRMNGAPFGVTGSSPAASAFAIALVEAFGGIAFAIEEEMRPLYHGALSHAANHLVTLLAGSADALAAAGVDSPYMMLGPLVRAALENSLGHGFAALSGPLRRGDDATVRNHLIAFERQYPAMLPAYRAMALATLDMMEQAGAHPSRACRALLTDLAPPAPEANEG